MKYITAAIIVTIVLPHCVTLPENPEPLTRADARKQVHLWADKEVQSLSEGNFQAAIMARKQQIKWTTRWILGTEIGDRQYYLFD